MTAPQEWRVPTAVGAAKLAVGAVLLVVTVVLARDVLGAVVGLVLAAASGLAGLRDVIAPVRLVADDEGLLVAVGLVGRRRLPWAEIERIRVDDGRRLFGRSTMLEIDAGANLYFLSRQQLGVTPAEAVDQLGALRTGR